MTTDPRPSNAEIGVPADQLDWVDTFDVYQREGDTSSPKYVNMVGLLLRDGGKRYQCKPCGLTFSKMGAGRRHLGREHPSKDTLLKRASRARHLAEQAKPAPAEAPALLVDQAPAPEALPARLTTGDAAIDSRIETALMMQRGIIATLIGRGDRAVESSAPLREENASLRSRVRELEAEIKTLNRTYGPLIRAAQKLAGSMNDGA